jgi:hypothetical protein
MDRERSQLREDEVSAFVLQSADESEEAKSQFSSDPSVTYTSLRVWREELRVDSQEYRKHRISPPDVRHWRIMNQRAAHALFRFVRGEWTRGTLRSDCPRSGARDG